MKMIRGLMLASLLVGAAAVAQSGAAQSDPYLWLEQKDSPRALAWVEAENARTLGARLQALQMVYFSQKLMGAGE